jgi:tRNA(Ile2)-agmatinylcytidine synthase
MRLGVDDTDAPEGGCTTHVLTELVALGRSHGLDVIGEPRLVRLNPNVPWKTRGNAALSVTLGHGRGPSRVLGEIAGAEVRGFARGLPARPEESRVFRAAAWELVRGRAMDAPGTDPALVVTERTLPASLYVDAVQRIVDPTEVSRTLRAAGAWVRSANSNRGIVGAAAAAAWPGRRRTWELIAYRRPGTTGPRRVDPRSVRRAASADPALFLCHDAVTRRLLVAPHTPCPILFGLRATNPESALSARSKIRSEPVDRWLLFRTNQGTGDHVRRPAGVPIAPFTPTRVRGPILDGVRSLRGGHVMFQLLGANGPVDCRAFEPTKSLPQVARALRPGDRVEVWGGTGEDPVVRVEGIRVLSLAPRQGPLRGPRCGRCHRPTKSLGRDRGYRCPGCHRRWPPEAGRRPTLPADLRRGTYHPTPSARRHLAPLAPEPGRTPASP